MFKKPELLSPAGTLKNLHFALAYGADAVYAGQPRYSLRVRNNDFNLAHLQQGIAHTHKLGKQFFLASNILPHNSKLKTYMQDIEPIIAMGPDALIMSDPGLIFMIREQYPDLPIHLSVQANTMNWASVKFWHQAGVQRIILSRELSLDEIEEIRQRCPEMELEVFVHGALCIAYSGRCLLSGYMNHRDPNQGTCTNACRWKYNAKEATLDDTGDIIAVQSYSPHSDDSSENKETTPATHTADKQPFSEKMMLLEEATRPGELMPAFEDEHGTYIMNSKDLRAIQHIHRLTKMGIDSLKIEGRTKSPYYVSRTAQTYRQAIDDATANKPFNMDLMDVLENLANRGYTEGFYRRHVHDEYQNYENGNSIGVHQQFVGEVLEAQLQGNALVINVKNRFNCGDQLEFMTPAGNLRFTLSHLQDIKGKQLEAALGSGHQVRIDIDNIKDCIDSEHLHTLLDSENLAFGLLMRDLPNAPERTRETM